MPMEIVVKNLHEKKHETFGVVRVIGSYTNNEAGEKEVALNGSTTHAELAAYDDSSPVSFDEKLGSVSVRENLSLTRIMDHVKTLRKNGLPDLSVDEYLKKAGYTFRGEPFTMATIYGIMGFNPKRDTLNFLLSSDKVAGNRELVPEIIRGFIRKDLVEKGIWAQLIASTRNIAVPEQIVPHINYSGAAAAMEATGESQHLSLGSVSFGRKTVRVTRRGVGISITDVVKRYVTVDQLGIYMADVSSRYNNDKTTDVLSILVNGDLPSSTDPVSALGVDNTTTRIAYKDYLRLFLRYMMTQYRPTTVIMSETEALRQLMVAEFIPTANNTAPRFQLKLGNSGMLEQATMWVHDDIANYKQLFLDKDYAVEHLVCEPLSVEEERKPSIETTAYWIRETSGFSNLIQPSKVLLDGTQTFASTGWPSYLTRNK